MNFEDLRRLVEERATGYYQHQKKTDNYPRIHENREQNKVFKAMIRSEILERFQAFNNKKISKVVITPQHYIYELRPGNRSHNYYGSTYDKVKVPSGANKEDFKLRVEIRMADGRSRYNCTRYNLTIDFVRHAKNMNWQTNVVECTKNTAGSYNDKTSEPMVYIARELEGLFGVEVSQVEKKYKSFKEKFKEGQNEITYETGKPNNDSVMVARRVRANGNQRVERTTQGQEVEHSEVELRFTEGTSNKFYRIKIRELVHPRADSLWDVVAFYARIGLEGIETVIISELESRDEALSYARAQERSKIKKGYTVYSGGLL